MRNINLELPCLSVDARRILDQLVENLESRELWSWRPGVEIADHTETARAINKGIVPFVVQISDLCPANAERAVLGQRFGSFIVTSQGWKDVTQAFGEEVGTAAWELNQICSETSSQDGDWQLIEEEFRGQGVHGEEVILEERNRWITPVASTVAPLLDERYRALIDEEGGLLGLLSERGNSNSDSDWYLAATPRVAELWEKAKVFFLADPSQL